MLPRRVISEVHDGQGMVWVVEKGHAPVRRTVGVGITDGHVMEITSGLQVAPILNRVSSNQVSALAAQVSGSRPVDGPAGGAGP